MSRGGYRPSEKVKENIAEIYKFAMMAHDIVITSTNLGGLEKRRLESCYKNILKLIKEICEIVKVELYD